MSKGDVKGIKAVLGKLKDAITNIDRKKVEGRDHLQALLRYLALSFHFIFTTEFLQRGTNTCNGTNGPTFLIIFQKNNGTEFNNDDCTLFENENIQMLSNVINVAGKALLDEDTSTIPKPLLMATCAISGMACEICAEICREIVDIFVKKEGNIKYNQITSLLTGWDAPTSGLENFKSTFENASKRCKEVGDDRIFSLLQLTQVPSSSVPPENTHFEHVLRQLQYSMLSIARTYFLRAAHEFSNPNVPQMWKRALDVTLLKQKVKAKKANLDIEDDVMYHTLDVALPLMNLARIASSKGNEKRASELYLRLVESFMSHTSTDIKGCAKSNKEDKQGHLIAPFLSNIPIASFSSKRKNIFSIDPFEEAQEALSKVDPSLVESEFPIYYEMLLYRMKLAVENKTIQCLFEERSQAAKNISNQAIALSSSAKRQSNEDAIRHEIFLENSKIVEEVDQAGYKLLLTITCVHESFTIYCYSFHAALQLLDIHINRFTNRVRALGSKKAFLQSKTKEKVRKDFCNNKTRGMTLKEFYSFVTKFLNWNLADNEVSNAKALSLQSKDLIMKVGISSALGIIMIDWIIGKGNTNSNQSDINFQIPLSQLMATKEYLYKCKSWNDSLPKDHLSQGVSSKQIESPESRVNSSLHCALSASLCLYWLNLFGEETLSEDKSDNENIEKVNAKVKNAAIKDVSNNSLEMAVKKYQSCHTRFGTPYLQFLMSWSGVHQRAWPFCSIIQARQIIANARSTLQNASNEWGRRTSSFENILLLLGEADSEGGLLAGGIHSHSETLYKDALKLLCDNNDVQLSLQLNFVKLLKSICLNGLARLARLDVLKRQSSKELERPSSSEQYAKESLEKLQAFFSEQSAEEVHFWTGRMFVKISVSYHLCTARRLVSESLLQSGKSQEALQFLQQAVDDAPNDYDAAVSLGAYRLRSMIFATMDNNLPSPSAKDEKRAQTQLLKAAKLDSNRADAFSLLGIFYELKKDLKRSVGCFSKASLLDPSHPVAGRGLLRLKRFEEVEKLVRTASSLSSPSNGWAWKSLGEDAAMNQGNDDLALVCFQQALRCKDIQSSDKEVFGSFYDDPLTDRKSDKYKLNSKGKECSKVWSLLAACYRRLGKYSAAIRAYNFAREASGSLSSSTVCSLAQVELDLGLYDEAIEKFDEVLNSEENGSHFIAAYGKATGLLYTSQRDINEGKFGKALSRLEIAISNLCQFIPSLDRPCFDGKENFSSTLKLLGDIYSFGVNIPSDIFLETDKRNFIAKGARAYEAVIECIVKSNTKDEHSLLFAAAACDLGTNQYIQAILTACELGEGSGGNLKMSDITNISNRNLSVNELLQNSINSFSLALDSNDSIAPAWCGLGCALRGTDPLLAQHCFCRAIELDKSSSESWANLALLYIDHDQISCGANALDALSQVADIPMMWIGRGMLLEKNFSTKSEPVEHKLIMSKAADAYRTALQVAQHPSALLGLSLTSRCNDKNGLFQEKEESKSAMSIYLNSCEGENIVAYLLSGIMDAEDGKDRFSKKFDSLGFERILHGLEKIQYVKTKLQEIQQSGEIGRAADGKDIPSLKTVSRNTGLPMKYLIEATSAALEAVDELKSTIIPGHIEEESKPSNKPSIYDAQRMVHENPDDCESWILLAKILAKESATIPLVGKSNHRKRMETFNAAKTASWKGITILHYHLTHPSILHSRNSQHAIYPTPINSALLSECFALTHWFDEVKNCHGKLDNDGDESDIDSSNMYVSLQRSLLVDPGNKMARAGLKRLSK